MRARGSGTRSTRSRSPTSGRNGARRPRWASAAPARRSSGGGTRFRGRGRTLGIPAEPILHPCPRCGVRTMRELERGGFDNCPVCDREDDLVQYADPDRRGGANAISLNEARARFAPRADAPAR
ncbi:MAG TPA: CPCC family cysteine-rich protein [Longimicrobium sp.]